MDGIKKQQKLEKIAKQVANCQKCDLCKQATKPVPGEGSPDAEIMFIGEGPGYHEDQRGIPFCGASGRLLDQLLQLIKMERKNVWIGNVVKHRPPGNRDPKPFEIEACSVFLDDQIETIDPKVIVTLGRFSMRKFLPDEFISRAHGRARYVNCAGKKRIVIPMYHPAAALRNGRVMAQIKQDFGKIPMYLENQSSLEPEETAVAKEKEAKQEQLSLI